MRQIKKKENLIVNLILKKKKQEIFSKWKSTMQDLRTNILFFNFVEKYYSELKTLNV
jgi:hypothetical protein